MSYAMLAKGQASIKEAAAAVVDNNWAFQQKFDGRRILVDISPHHVHVNNRLGDHSSYTARILDVIGEWAFSIKDMGASVVFDGEWVNDTYQVFDIMSCDFHTDKDPYFLRWANLRGLLQAFDSCHDIQMVRTAFNEDDKQKLVEKCYNEGAEGVILRKLTAPYVTGRTDNIKKLKFTRSLDAVVMEHNDGRDSVKVGLVDGDNVISIGNCSVRYTTDVHIGDVVEISYLYATNNSRLVQPVLVRVREDKDPHDCGLHQLHYGATEKVIATQGSI